MLCVKTRAERLCKIDWNRKSVLLSVQRWVYKLKNHRHELWFQGTN